LIKEIKADINKWKNIPRPRIGRINIVKVSIPLKSISRFSAIPVEFPIEFFTEVGKNY